MTISYIDNSDKWYDHFYQATLDEKFEMFTDLLDNPPADDVLIDDDFGSVFVEAKASFIREKRFDDLVYLIETAKDAIPKFFLKEFPYLCNDVIAYYLYTGNMEKVTSHLQIYLDNPIADVDTFNPIYNKMRYYKHTELALQAANTMALPIKDSDQFISGAEVKLVDTIFYQLFEDYFTALSMKHKGDWEHIITTLKQYDYHKEMFEIVLPKIKITLDALAEDPGKRLFTNEEWSLAIHENDMDAFRNLYWSLAIHMLHEKQIPFEITADIWFNFTSFMIHKETSSTDCSFKESELDSYIVKYFQFMSNDEEIGFASLWGLPYIYDFLSDQALVAEEIKENSLKHIKAIKKMLMHSYRQELWNFDFVHAWGKPASISMEEWSEEQDKFAKSFTEKPAKSEQATLQPRLNTEQLSFDLFGEPKKGTSTSKSDKMKLKNKNKKKQARKQRKKNRSK